MISRKFPFLIAILLLLPIFLLAQGTAIKGLVVNSLSGRPEVDVTVTLGKVTIMTGENGEFRLQSEGSGTRAIVFAKEGFAEYRASVILDGAEELDLGRISLVPERQEELDDIRLMPTITLTEQELETDDSETQDISGILSASRDVFVSAAAYTFSGARFRIRGYDSENTDVLINGIPMNDPDNGRVYWSIWGGLNDVTRNRVVETSLGPSEYAFGGVGGSTSFDMRPSSQRKQLRVSYSIANRSYRNRLMATWSSGMLPGNWSISVSASRRWAEEGYVDGTFYDGYAYYLGIEKKFNEQHSLSLIGFGSRTRRGRSTAVVQELYDLTGDNYYNPYWGMQEGEKRNARVAEYHRPVGMLIHEWNISDRTRLSTAVSYQTGRGGSTSLDWNNARDPRPDYYRYLPGYNDDPSLVQEVADKWRTDIDTRQIDWAFLYETNRNAHFTVENANGIQGNTISGTRARYVVEDRRYDPTQWIASTTLRHQFSDKIALNAGLFYQSSTVENFKKLDDLLGADYYLDIDKYAERDFYQYDLDIVQSDLQNPLRIAYEGDLIGYHFDINREFGNAWVQGDLRFRKVDFFAGLQVNQTQYWRTGHFQNGIFPDNSLGDSEKKSFTTYQAKAGATYKITGRHYVYGNGFAGTRAPYTRNAFLSNRANNSLNPFSDEERIFSVEGGYQLRSPFIKARASAYYTTFEDLSTIRPLYNDIERTFGYFILSGQDYVHKGLEFAAEVKVSPTVTVSGVVAMGDYHLTSRPVAATIDDRSENFIFEDETIYSKNFYVSGTPLTAAAVTLGYSSPRYWFANLTFSYYDDIFIDYNPNRRRTEAVAFVEYGSEQWNEIVDQEKVDAGYSLDLFGGKSWKFDDIYLYLNVGINNILDDQDLITGGYEQTRFDGQDRDPDAFGSRYYYRYGLNYFINLSVRM